MIGVLDMKLPPALDLAVSIFSQRSTISFVGYSCPYLLPLPLSGTNQDLTQISLQRVETVQSHFNFQIYGWIRTIGTYFFIQLNRKVIVDMLVAIRF